MARRGRWKTFYLSSEVRDVQSVADSFKGSGRTVKIDRYPGGGILETDLPVSECRALFRAAGARFRDYVTADAPSWEEEEEGALTL
jgi:hypothetical protein